MVRLVQGLLRFDGLDGVGGARVATTLRREVMATVSPLRICRKTSGNAFLTWRTVAVLIVSLICLTKADSQEGTRGSCSVVPGGCRLRLNAAIVDGLPQQTPLAQERAPVASSGRDRLQTSLDFVLFSRFEAILEIANQGL